MKLYFKLEKIEKTYHKLNKKFKTNYTILYTYTLFQMIIRKDV